MWILERVLASKTGESEFVMNIVGLNVASVNKQDFKEKIVNAIESNSVLKIGKINTEFLCRAFNDDEFSKTLNDFDLNIPDGRGVLWAARYLTLPVTEIKILRPIHAIWQMVYSGGAIIFNPKFITYPISENIPGVEALKLMLQVAEETSSSVFFFGATQDDLEGAVKNIKKEMPELKVAGSLNGYDFQKDKHIDPVHIINNTDAKILIVALGSPLQEYWIRDNIKRLRNVRVAVGEGGSLAFLAGTLKRAPEWANRIGLEWLWRLLFNKSLTHQTGSRLKRVWNAVPVFIVKIVNWEIKNA